MTYGVSKKAVCANSVTNETLAAQLCDNLLQEGYSPIAGGPRICIFTKGDAALAITSKGKILHAELVSGNYVSKEPNEATILNLYGKKETSVVIMPDKTICEAQIGEDGVFAIQNYANEVIAAFVSGELTWKINAP